ncbi:hypothetical protein [Citrobacter braakii]|uniref:hypothetical protein n=1 Tax=Citrobacter braakii TaxID=57706 RepID=UPI0040394061
MEDRQLVKNLLQYLTDHALHHSAEFTALQARFNITTTVLSSRSTFSGAQRHIVMVYSSNASGAESFEFNSLEAAESFAATRRRDGDAGGAVMAGMDSPAGQGAPLWLREQGDANHYVLLKDKGWFAHVQMNGEMSVSQQKMALQSFVEWWNNGK